MRKNRLLVLTFLFMALGILFGSIEANAATYYTTDDGNYTFEILEDGTASIHRYTGTETDVTVPATITGNGQTYVVSELGQSAFIENENILNVTISEGIVGIGAGAFYYCSNLKTVNIPSTARFKDVVENAFSHTDNLKYIDVDDNNPMYFDIDGVNFYHSVLDYGDICMHRYPSAKIDTTYVIPEGTDYIDYDVFQNVKYLRKLVFPKFAKDVMIDAVKNPLNPIEIYLTTTDLTCYGDKCFNKLPAGSKVYVQTDALAEEAVRLLANSPDAEIVSLESNPDAGMPCTALTFADGSTEKSLDMELTTTYQIAWEMAPYGATDALTWTSSNTEVATVNALSGLVECIGKGTAVITGADEHGHSVSLTVNGYVDITDVRIARDVNAEDIMNFDSDGSSMGESLYVTMEHEAWKGSTNVNRLNYDFKDDVEIVVSNPDILQVEYDSSNREEVVYDIVPLSVGTVTVYVNVTDYDGTVYKSNEITYVIKEDISEWRWDNVLNKEEFQEFIYYTGSEITPNPVVVDCSEDKILVEGTDYTVTYENNVNVGQAKCYIQGTGYYYGETYIWFTIYEKDISTCTLIRNGDTFTVEDGKIILTEGVDYTCIIYYSDDETNKYITDVAIIGMGNYTGGIQKSYDNDTPGSDSGNTGGSTDNSDNSNTNTGGSADNGSDSAGSNSDTNNDSTINGSTDNSSNNNENTDESQSSLNGSTKKLQTITGKDLRTAVYRKNGSLFLNCKAKTTLTYTSSNPKVATVDSKGKVTIKGTGACTITVTAKGTNKYEAATKTITIKVAPKKAVLSKVKSNKKKTITVSWKKDKLASGYQIQYATNKSFKKAKTVNVSGKKKSATIKKLKAGKKYYVRIRAYKTVEVDGKQEKLYSSYSGKKTVKVKK